ncbi:MAG: hypothetical protein RLZZ76_631 [Candidatus Parcubacteria bacterium]|jgi:flagellar biosynthesis protein FliQ
MIFEKIQLETDEVVLRVVRRHWFYICMHVLPLLLATVTPLLLVLFGASYIPQTLLEMTKQFIPHLLFLYTAWILGIWMTLASLWTDYYLDIWCITNKRIIKIDQVALFRRRTGSFRLERMQDVNVEVNGIIATLLDYGSVHVQTASADLEEFKAVFLPKPQEIKSIILEAGDKLMEKQGVNNLL